MTEDLFEFAARQSEPEPLPPSDPAQATMQFLLSLRERGIANIAVLRALETLPREQFVPHRHADLAWRDIALPIACGQTMPEPFLVARMVESLNLLGAHRVLEVGTGNGYSTAILARIAREVISVERFHSLAVAAATRLAGLGLANAQVLHGDGLNLSDEIGLFDRIILQGSVKELPAAILSRLAEGGVIVYARQGDEGVSLMRLLHEAGGFRTERVGPCRLQPLIAGSLT
jgi:protein-L-isoaspartate(D-aspartate) O-methyltransferase